MDSKYQCKTCNKQFKSKGGWSQHELRNTCHDLKHSCLTCSRRFKSKAILNRHVKNECSDIQKIELSEEIPQEIVNINEQKPKEKERSEEDENEDQLFREFIEKRLTDLMKNIEDSNYNDIDLLDVLIMQNMLNSKIRIIKE